MEIKSRSLNRQECFACKPKDIKNIFSAVDSYPSLYFYVIKDEKYSDKYKEIFLESILPKIREWYHATLSKPETSIPGVEKLLVEWTGDSFKIHNCRYA